MNKRFKLNADELRPLVTGYGACIASDMITVEGFPVRFMYREAPDSEVDGGWRFMSGLESEGYMNEPGNFALYDVNTIANYDPSIIPLLDSPIGCAFEKAEGHDHFTSAEDWGTPDE